jgi:hypothetical protein
MVNGSPSMSQIAAEFGGSAPHSLNEYYGVRFSYFSPSAPDYAPSSGTISLSNFRNRSKYVPPWNPPSECFSPDTKIKLENGNVINIKDVMLGDILEGGVSVNVTLQIRNIDKVPFYKLFNSALNEYIYVTGSHMIKEGDDFVRVDQCASAELSDVINDSYICLITDNHKIPVGEHTFWDWADQCDVCDVTIPK